MWQELEEVHIVKNYNSINISPEEYNIIDINRRGYILGDMRFNKPNLNYPGFVFSSDVAASMYHTLCYSKYIEGEIYTPPRGNLSVSNPYIFMGIKPGKIDHHKEKKESAWLFGPSSKMLHNLLIEKSIYPYFTNVYKSSDEEESGNLDTIFRELLVIFTMYKQHYGLNNMTIVYMGSYDEYWELKARLDKDIKGFNIEYKKIWHPAYLTRTYSEQKFIEWGLSLS